MTEQHTSLVTPALSRRPRASQAPTDGWAPAQGRGDGKGAWPPFALSLACIALLLATPAFAQQTETDAQSAERYFDRLDQKKQGFFTLADLQRIEGKVFKRTDEDKNGLMTLDEYVGGIPVERTDIIERFTRRFRLADADDSGEIIMEEYMAFCANVVAASDANQDGMVTKEEFVAAAGGGAAE